MPCQSSPSSKSKALCTPESGFVAAGYVEDLGPAGDEVVEAQRVFGPAVALSDTKQQVRQFFHEVGVNGSVGTAQRCLQEVAGRRDAVSFQTL